MPVYIGDTAKAVFNSSGTEPIQSQIEWLIDTNIIDGANLPSIIIPNAAAGKTLYVKLTLTNVYGSTTKTSDGIPVAEDLLN